VLFERRKTAGAILLLQLAACGESRVRVVEQLARRVMRRALIVTSLLAVGCTFEQPAAREPSGGKIEPKEETPPVALSETGLYADITTRALADSVVPYEVRYQLWSDGAEKQRHLLLPEGSQIDTSDIDGWRFPIGTKAWKTFFFEGRAIETRLLEKLSDGDDGWRHIAFVWSEDGRDAYAEPDGVRDALGTTHDVPSSEDCVKCHRGAADGLIGVAALQATSATLDAWLAADRLTHAPPALRAPPGDRLTQQVLGYLNANCGHCHNDRHPLARDELLRLALPLGIDRAEETPLYRTGVCATSLHEIDGTSHIVLPGSPQASQLFVRMQLRGDVQMPPLATERPDDDALELLAKWIDSLRPCE
jgi:hypothetical protein